MTPGPTYLMRDSNPRSVPDNRTPYLQGRSDQRRRDWPVIAVCVMVIALFIVFGDMK